MKQKDPKLSRKKIQSLTIDIIVPPMEMPTWENYFEELEKKYRATVKKLEEDMYRDLYGENK